VTLGSKLFTLVPGRLPAPPALTPPASPAFAGEGQWRPFGPVVNGLPGAYATTIRPDAVHTSSVIGVVWFDPHAVSFRQFPGTKIPGSPWDRPPSVPAADQSRLIAAFSGGFRIANSHGGMLLGGRQLQAMRTGAATFAVDTHGVPTVGAWGTDMSTANSLDSARQNLDLIVENGALNPSLATDPNHKWGFTGPANQEFVWRSGAGVLPNGAIVWVGGPGLSVVSLADEFVRLGAVRAMQLDINQEWMQFVSYSVGADGQVHGRRLLNGMRGPDDRWLTTDTRDFIAVFTRG
jgi:hypothetical protein